MTDVSVAVMSFNEILNVSFNSLILDVESCYFLIFDNELKRFAYKERVSTNHPSFFKVW